MARGRQEPTTRTVMECEKGHRFHVESKSAGVERSCPTCGTPLKRIRTTASDSTHSGAKTPRTIGRYEIRAKLGQGGFGTVYLAQDTQLDRQVALKVPVKDAVDDVEQLEAFMTEARAAAQLRHPNIVPVYDVGIEHGTHFIASAYIPPGKTLGEYVAELKDGLAPEIVARLIHQLAGALGYAHSLGIIHRDVKPDNVLINQRNDPCLSDFGLAKHVDGAEASSQARVLGTPAYMSPEQASGQSDDVDTRSDVWSLGVVLYELLAGHRPFEGGNSIQLRYAVMNLDPAPLPNGVPKGLAAICNKCLKRDPNDRYQNALELAYDLERWREKEPTLAADDGRIARAKLWCQRNPRISRLTGAAIALLMFMLFGTTTSAILMARQSRDLQLAANKRKSERVKADKAANLAKVNEQRLKREEANLKKQRVRRIGLEQQLNEAHRQQRARKNTLTAMRREIVSRKEEYKSRDEELDRVRSDNQRLTELLSEVETKAADSALDEYAKALDEVQTALADDNKESATEILNKCETTLRNWEWDVLAQKCGVDLFEVERLSDHWQGLVAVSDDGRYVIADQGSARQTLVFAQGQPAHWTIPGKESPGSLAVSQNGRVASWHGTRVTMWQLGEQPQVKLLASRNVPERMQWLRFAGAQDTLFAGYRLSPPNPQSPWSKGELRIRNMDVDADVKIKERLISVDGKHAIIDGSSEPQMIELKTGGDLQFEASVFGAPHAFLVSPDGDHLLLDHGLRRTSLSTPNGRIVLLPTDNHHLTPIFFTRDSRRVVCGESHEWRYMQGPNYPYAYGLREPHAERFGLGRLVVFDTATGQRLLTFTAGDSPSVVALHGDVLVWGEQRLEVWRRN